MNKNNIPSKDGDQVASKVKLLPKPALEDIWEPQGLDVQVNKRYYYIPREILCTDRGNAIRLLNRERQNIIYVKGIGFCIWNGKFWETEAESLLQQKIVETHNEMIIEIELQPDKATRKAMAEWVKQSNNQSRITAVINHLKLETSIKKDIALLDQNDWLINFQNGTFDLFTSELKDFRQEDFITQALPFDYDPAAKCSEWIQFISQILKNKLEAEWLQRVIGYTLTGETAAQFFMFCFGVGGNGKGILLQTLLEMMGPYGESLPPESFMVKMNDGGVPNDIALIRGKRLVIGSEVPSGKKWNEALLKQLTGSDPVKARFLRQEFFTFKPRCKIWISGNPRPAVSDSGNAFWRRLKLVEFKEKFDNPDLELGARLKKELPGIFNWALTGLEWALAFDKGLSDGLKPPPTIEAETEEYRLENDTVSRFIQDKCIIDKTNVLQIPAHKAFTEYVEWCKEQGESLNMLNNREFPKKMIALGYEKKKGTKHNVFLGLDLDKTPPETSSILPPYDGGSEPKMEEVPPKNWNDPEFDEF